jgi:hypothetical protein
MKKNIAVAVCAATIVCMMSISVSTTAAEPINKENAIEKTRNFIKKLFSYPANVINGSVEVVADTGKRGTDVLTKEISRTGEIVSGETDKVKDFVTEPLTGTAEVVVKAAEETGKIPVEAANEPA